MLKQLISI